MDNTAIARTIRAWVRDFVIAEGLCPFARRPCEADSIRYSVSDAGDEATLIEDLSAELTLLAETSEVETTLLIHPRVLEDFDAYNQFLDLADRLIQTSGLEGVIQVASFHPDYQFAGTRPGDAENYSNRSPFPMLHLIREASIEAAVDGHPDVDGIPERNVAHLNTIGAAALERRRRALLTAGVGINRRVPLE